MKNILAVFIFSVLVLVGCSSQSDVSEDFLSSAYYHVEDPGRQLAFFEESLYIGPKEIVKPHMTEKEMDEMRENYSDYEVLEFENIKVIEANDNTFEVVDAETDEVVFEFEIDSETGKLISGEDEFLPMNE